MKVQILACGLLASLAALAPAARLRALEGLAQPEPAHPGRPAATALEAQPTRILIERPADYCQLLLTASDAGGRRFDATRLAHVEGRCEELEIDERGLVRPLRDGEGVLLLTLDGVEVPVPYEVRGMQSPPVPSFRRDVMPVLSASGCNTGSCHGSAEGKHGFKLSLRGYDPSFDHAALTDDLFSRRFDRVRPERSLFLLKPTAAVPHEGGQALVPGSHDYETVLAWARDGARHDAQGARVARIEILPSDATIPTLGGSQQFAILATYSDGRRADVTAHAFVETNDTEVTAVDKRALVTGLRRGEAAILARFEGQYAATRLYVRGEREGWSWQQPPTYNYIDEQVYAKLREVESGASELCSDADFLRRATLDLTGTLPSVRATRQFLMDSRDSRTKREELVDRLIGSPDFVDCWTSKWCDLLQVNTSFLGQAGAQRFHDWVQAAVASNRPYDDFVHALLDSSGKVSKTPAASYYKILREPDQVMENSTQLFLGIRFNCNKCHDHPFERWTQKDHWQLAAYFAQVQRTPVEGSPMLSEGVALDEVIGDGSEGEVHYPESTRVAPAAFPYSYPGQAEPEGPLRAQLAAWVTAPENPYFARSMANRLWSYFMGRGLIEPVDDIRAGNPATHPELLERLTRQFIDEGFDLRSLMRTICTSRVYQHSVKTTPWNEGDDVNYGHALARRLPSEVLFDALHRAAGTRAELPGVRRGTRALQVLDSSVKSPDGFLDLFGRPARESACECERGHGMSLGQALNLVNGPTLADALRAGDGRIAELLEVERDPRAIIEELYLAFLCRYPTEEELHELAPTLEPLALANRVALAPDQLSELERSYEAWKSANRPVEDWEVLRPVSAVAASQTQLLVQGDGSVLAQGERVESDSFTIVAPIAHGGITGLRLEVLAEESYPKGGPGRSDSGNFVLNELHLDVVPVGMPTAAAPVALQHASSTYSQQGFDVAGAIDGNPTSGWAVYGRQAETHVAVFECQADIEAEGGALLLLNLEQNFGSGHTIGHLRLSVTRSPRPLRQLDLPEEVVAALQRLLVEPDPAAQALVYSHFMGLEPEWQKRLLSATSQDLAWALANSPAFLFNR